jgi:metal-responsive CopG/Arc/MetJ family transcriptional regulator
MRCRNQGDEHFVKINILINKQLLSKIDDFLGDPGLREDKMNRSLFIRDILNWTLKDLEKNGKKSILENLYPTVD